MPGANYMGGKRRVKPDPRSTKVINIPHTQEHDEDTIEGHSRKATEGVLRPTAIGFAIERPLCIERNRNSQDCDAPFKQRSGEYRPCTRQAEDTRGRRHFEELYPKSYTCVAEYSAIVQKDKKGGAYIELRYKTL